MFTSFTLSQAGMVRHWSRRLAAATVDGAAGPPRARVRRAQALNLTGAVLTGTVLVVVFATKLPQGAWLAVLAMAALYWAMGATRRYYTRFEDELAAAAGDRPSPPSQVHAIVLVARVNRPVLRAVALARALRPDSVEAVSATQDPREGERLRADWAARGIAMPLRLLDAPYRDIGPPLVRHIAGLGRAERGVVVVFVPEYVVARWWQNLLHNQTALRLKARLLQEPGVVVVDVPYHLGRREHGWLGGAPERPAGR